MGLLSGWSLKNPLQPLTHAAGKTVGVTANTKNGIHVDPVKLALTAGSFALPGVGTALSHIPVVGGALASGANAIGGAERSVLGKIPGASSVAQLLGLGGSAAGSGGAPGAAADEESAIPDSAMPAKPGGGILETILGNAKAEAGRVVGRLERGQSPISVGGSAAAGSGGSTGSAAGGTGGLSPLLLELLAGAQGVSAAQAYSKMGDLQNKALNTAETNYAQRAPLRTAGVAGMTAAPVKLNLPSTGNPFAMGAAA